MKGSKSFFKLYDMVCVVGQADSLQTVGGPGNY